MKKLASLGCLLALLGLTACDSSDSVTSDDLGAGNQIVITDGIAAPAATVRPVRSGIGAPDASLGGSEADAVSLKPSTCETGSSQQVTVTYTVTGRQANSASFKVNTAWSYDGTNWTGTSPSTVSVPARAAADAATTRSVDVTVANGSTVVTGTSTFTIAPFDVVTSSPAALDASRGNVTLHVAFVSCPVTNTAPTLVVPSDFPVEATSSAGAPVNPLAYVTANDSEDGDLTSAVACTPASGTFGFGETEFTCSVTDSGGLSDSGSFTITVQDTTAPVFSSFPSGTVSRIAQNVSGWAFDRSSFGLTAGDVNAVSEPVVITCNPDDGTPLTIGSTTSVSCTATDSRENMSEPRTFDVFVGLNVDAQGFLPPLRMADPYSAHKKGSTIPHKVLPPTYADGTPATDLVGLRLVVTREGGSPIFDTEDAAVDFSAGSTAWRYEDGQYIYNVKTGSAWNLGAWSTTVSYAGITLATTHFSLKR